MYHPMVPPPMIMQIVRSQQTNGQCTSPAQTHALHTNHNTNTATRQTEYTQYVSDEPGNNRRFYMQVRTFVNRYRKFTHNFERIFRLVLCIVQSSRLYQLHRHSKFYRYPTIHNIFFKRQVINHRA